MQLPERTPSTAQPTLPEGSLTAKLQARRPGTEALPGDHGARFGDELEQAAAREAGSGAEGRRGQRRAADQRRDQRAERGEATDAREARQRHAEDAARRRRLDAAGTDSTDQAPAVPMARQDMVRRRVATERGQHGGGAKLPVDPGAPEGSQRAMEPPDPTTGSTGMPGALTAPSAAALAPAVASSPATSAAPEAVAASNRTQRTAPVAAPTATEPKGAAETGPKPTAAPAADAMGELLAQREEALDKEASILRQLRAQLAPGRREVTLRLDPADLGRLQLRLALRAGRLTASVRAESPEALAAIERQLPELAASLEAQGFEVQAFDLDLAEGGLAGDTSQGGAGRTPAAPLPHLLTMALGGDAAPATPEPSSAAPRRSPDSTELDLLV